MSDKSVNVSVGGVQVKAEVLVETTIPKRYFTIRGGRVSKIAIDYNNYNNAWVEVEGVEHRIDFDDAKILMEMADMDTNNLTAEITIRRK